MRRLAIWLPVVLVLAMTSAVFLAARAPRTWAAHWSVPNVVARGASEQEYGAADTSRGWDILWVNDDRQVLILTRAGRQKSLVLDHGDVTQPALLRIGGRDVAAWVHNHNGSTDLMAAEVGPHGPGRVFELVGGPWPIEHPYLFPGPRGTIDLVFSWQRDGNFDAFLLSLHPRAERPVFLRRLTRARIYAFYPRAVLNRAGHIFLLYLDLCCRGHVWHVSLARYDSLGHRLGPVQTLTSLTGAGSPGQWGEDLRLNPDGRVWGAYAGDAGIWVFRVADVTPLDVRKRLLDPLGGLPASLALALGPREDDLLWEQPFDLGTYLASQRFTSTLEESAPERVVYEAAAQTEIHAVWQRGKIHVLWQAITPSLRSTFETATSTGARHPDLAQRFGLGLGNPWEALAVLVVVAMGVAALTTTGNVLTILIFILVGLIVMRILARMPGRWMLFGIALAAVLGGTFVVPGGPILFLATLPAMGLPTVPFGVLAVGAVLALLLWLSDIALRRVEDLFRIGILVVAGVYFFAFLEAIVFVQQRLGYI